MSYKEFMNKIRTADNMVAKWLMRHFYFTFFQIVLIIIFVFWFINLLDVIDISMQTQKQSSVLEHILASQSINLTLITVLVILNSFWLLFTFNSLQRMITILKDMNYHLSRSRFKEHL